MEHWKKQKEAAERKRAEQVALQKLYPWCPPLGSRVRRKARKVWEEGLVVLVEGEPHIKYIEDATVEQLDFLPYQIWDEDSSTFIDS